MKTFAQHWKETPSLTPMNSEEQAQVWFLKGMAEAEVRQAEQIEASKPSDLLERLQKDYLVAENIIEEFAGMPSKSSYMISLQSSLNDAILYAELLAK